MRCLLRLFIIILVVVHSHVFAAADEKDILFPEERQWLIKHDGKVRYAPLPNYPPIEFVDSEGTHQGLTPDYLRRIEQELNFRFAKVQVKSWNEIIEKAKQGEIDVIGSIQNSPERREYLRFTKSYLEIPNVIIVREEYHRPLTLEKMEGMKVVIVKGYATFDFIKNKYPKLILEAVNDDLEGLQMVSFGRADAIITDLSVASYLIEQMKISNLRVAGTTGYAWNITFASRKDWPILNNILEKGLAAIDQKERRAIYSKWVPSGYEDLFPRKKLLFYITIILSITGGGVVLIFIWNRMLKRQVIQKTVQLRRELEERKQAEEALRESEGKYKLITETSQTGIYMHQDDIIIYANDKFAQLHGYTVDELIGTYYFNLFHPDERERALGIKSKRLRGDEDAPQYHETKRVKKDGGILWCQTVAVLIEYQGKPAIMGNVVDITVRKRAEESLRESEEKYRRLFELESDAIFLIEKDTGKILEVNASAADLYGFSREELLRMKNVDLSAEAGKTKQATQDQLTQIPIRHHRKKDGTVFPVEITASHMNWKGREAHIATIRDITFRVEAESAHAELEKELYQARKMESIGTLAGGIAHDFNNILAIIVGYTELAVLDVPEWNPAKGYLKEIQTASLRAKDLVRHILSFSRKAVTDRKPIKIGLIIEDSLKMLRASIPADIEIRQNNSCEFDTILADPTQISQVLINLCTNAAHAMRDEGGILAVSLQNVEFKKQNVKSDLGPGRYVKLSVSDTGHGIDPENVDRIFDPYFTTKGLGEGTGLGLSVVQGIVKTHSGTVTVKSKLGKGTVFEVLIPLTEAESQPEDEKAEAFPTGNEKILFIDDEESILNLVKKRLEMQGYQVEAKNDPVDALELFRSRPDRFDLVITDMTMPKMTGDKLTKEILGIRPEMPIILCSGFSDKIDTERAMSLGIRKYIEKPLKMSDFLVSIRKVLDEAKS